MPFEKTGRDSYRSPSGRKFSGKQVRLYYANDGFPGRSGGAKRKATRRKSRSRSRG